jgi:hypothetical protein
MRSRTPLRSRSWPPRPIVEDEIDALAKEFRGVSSNTRSSTFPEIPSRGTVDQHPIILEAEVSAADAAKLHDKLKKECLDEAKAKNADNGERRFVLVDRNETFPPVEDKLEDKTPRKPSADTLPKKPTQERPARQDAAQRNNSPPSLRHRRSRQDLPTLQTELAPDALPFKRSSSAYAYTPKAETAKTTLAPSADYLLSPEALQAPKPQTKGHLENQLPSRQGTPTAVPAGRLSTPVVEKRRSGGQSPSSRPTTPSADKDKRSNGSTVDSYGRPRQDTGDGLARPQQVSEDVSTCKQTRQASLKPDRAEREDRSRTSSVQSNTRYYLSSDDDLVSTDDEKPHRRSHRHHHGHHRHRSLRPEDERDRHQRAPSKSPRSSLDVKLGSRHPSPLPSPKVSPSQLPADKKDVQRRDTMPATRDARRPSSRPPSPVSAPPESLRSSSTPKPSSGQDTSNTRSPSRHAIPIPGPANPFAGALLGASLPIPIPTRIDLQLPGESRRSPSLPKYEDDIDPRPVNGRNSANQKPYWQPPQFQPPSDPSFLERPVGSFRRHSQDVERGSIAPLPTCPRIIPVKGFIDWLTIPKCPNFNICPSCFASTMLPTEFRTQFVPAPFRSPSEEIGCDFGSQPWYRIAWLITLKERRKDLSILQNVASVADKFQPCLGRHEAIRKWYTILDPDTDKPLRNFDVCGSCAKSIEILLPSLRGIFIRSDQVLPADYPRICDMRFDSKRFIHYFDSLETTADIASQERRGPDITDFADLARRFASQLECPKDSEKRNAHWYQITQLPEFTVCDECYGDVIRPELEKRKAIPAMFNKSRQPLPVGTCQLYSERMRAIFDRAVDGNDYKLLATKARDRKIREGEQKTRIAEQKKLARTNPKAAASEIDKLEKEWRRWE